MFYFNNWELTADCEVIARQHDNLTRSLAVTGDIPPGWTWEMYVSVGEDMDILPMTADELGISVLLTAQNLPVAGEYTFELHGTQGEKKHSTNSIRAYIPPTMSGDAHWPEIPTAFTDLEKRMQALANTYPTIGENGNWFISGKDTGVLAKGLTPFIGSNGNWWIGEEDTGVLADPAELRELSRQAQLAKSAAENAADKAKESEKAAISAQEVAIKSANTAVQSANAAIENAKSSQKNAATAFASANNASASAISASKDADRAQTAADHADAALSTVDWAFFDITEDGDLIMERSDAQSGIDFALSDDGILEVNYE